MNSLINRIFIYFYFVLLLLLLLYKKSKYNSVEGFQGGLQEMKSRWRAESVGGRGGFYSVSIIHEWVSGREREGEREGGREGALWGFDCCLFVCQYGGVLFSFPSSASVLKNIKIFFGDLYAKCRKVWWLFS